MARTRIIVDVEHEEPLTSRQMKMLASNASDWLQAVGASEIQNKNADGAYAHGHLHVSTYDVACQTCVALAQDGRQ